MHTNRPAYLRDALALIKRTDPDTYARMIASDWNVCVISNPSDAPDDWNIADIWDFFSSQGETDPDTENTWLNTKGLSFEAKHQGISFTHNLAGTLIHEFNHTRDEGGNGEDSAFNAGDEFFRKLGDQAMIKENNTVRHYETGE